MQEINLSVKVKTNAEVTPERIAEILGRLIDAGLADAAQTVSNGEGDVDAAELATDLSIAAPVIAQTPRVLVVVSGGIADPVFDDGVDVEVFDWDNYNDDPEGTGGVPASFADLAVAVDIPVEGD